MLAHYHRFPDYEFADHWHDFGGLRMHYVDEGQGRPVVMVHGNPNWSFYYRHLVTALRDTHRCVVPDHIGCGLSDKPDDTRYPYSLEQRIDDLERLLDAVGVTESISLVVHDWGGMIGMGYAVRHPERISRLVVLNTAAFHLPPTKRQIPWQLRLARSPWLGAWLVRGMNAFSRGAVKSCVTRQPMPASVANAYCAPYDNWANRIAVHRFVQDIPLNPQDRGYRLITDIDTKLPQLRGVPMLIGWGERDFVFDNEFLHEWEIRFPQAEVHRFPDCGHYVLEDAAPELVPLITQFIRRP